MSLQTMKPTSPGRRHQVRPSTAHLYKGRPHDALLESKSGQGGRNNAGRITTRHQGGGHKQHYRLIDFKRDKDGIVAKVETIEHDPNSSAHIALVCYTDGERRYISRRAAWPWATRSFGRHRRHQAWQRAAAAQHPGRHQNPLRRDAAGQARAAGALGGRRGAAGLRAKASTSRCACDR